MAKKDYFSLSPSSKSFFGAYITGWLLMPLLGFGYLWLADRAKRLRVEYRIHNDKLVIVKQDVLISIPFLQIESMAMAQSFWDKTFGIGSLVVHASEGVHQLHGIEDVAQLMELLQQNVATLKAEQLKPQANTEGDYAHIRIGGFEHLNSLVGLWQAGMISDEDFQREKEKFLNS